MQDPNRAALGQTEADVCRGGQQSVNDPPLYDSWRGYSHYDPAFDGLNDPDFDGFYDPAFLMEDDCLQQVTN
jgi:hypothetical protein